MIKRTITIATILLVILGAAIAVAKASPRVNRVEVYNQRASVETNGLRGLVRVNLQRDRSDVKNLRGDDVLDLRGLDALNKQLRLDEASARFHVVHVDYAHAEDLRDLGLAAVHNQLHFDGLYNQRVPDNLYDQRDLAAVYVRLNVYNRRASVPRHLDDVKTHRLLTDVPQASLLDTPNVEAPDVVDAVPVYEVGGSVARAPVGKVADVGPALPRSKNTVDPLGLPHTVAGRGNFLEQAVLNGV